MVKILNPELSALQDAKFLFQGARGIRKLDKSEVLNLTRSLNEWGFFTIIQLSQISGYSVSTVRNWVGESLAPAGQFNPLSLDTLIQLRLDFNNGRKPNKLLVSAALTDGNSISFVARASGYSQSQVKKIGSNRTGL